MRKELSQSENYIEQTFIKANSRRDKIVQAIQEIDKDGIQINPAEGQLIKVLISMIGAKKIVEIGTLLGYSTTWLLEAAGKDGHIWSFEKSKDYHNIASEILKEELEHERLSLLLGDAKEELKKIEDKGPFDVVFIDANKSAYMDYYQWADKNLKAGGLIIADNTFLFGQVYQEQPSKNQKAWRVMKELNQTLAESPKYESILIPTSEGLSIALKKEA